MSPSHLHQMNVTENNETTSIPDDHTTKDQNELDIKPSNHLWCDNLCSVILDTKLTCCPAQGSSFKQRQNQGYQGQVYWRNNLNYIHHEIYPYLLTRIDDYTEWKHREQEITDNCSENYHPTPYILDTNTIVCEIRQEIRTHPIAKEISSLFTIRKMLP